MHKRKHFRAAPEPPDKVAANGSRGPGSPLVTCRGFRPYGEAAAVALLGVPLAWLLAFHAPHRAHTAPAVLNASYLCLALLILLCCVSVPWDDFAT